MGRKADFSSLPGTAFSVEAAAKFDLVFTLGMDFSGLGKVKPELNGDIKLIKMSRLVAGHEP